MRDGSVNQREAEQYAMSTHIDIESGRIQCLYLPTQCPFDFLNVKVK